MKVYLASSWRNSQQPEILEVLKSSGHAVYDFRNPAGLDTGFSWSKCDPNWQSWTTEEYIKHLSRNHEALRGFNRDQVALQSCEVLVLLTPCGRSAHTEFGYAAGAGKFTIIYITEDQEPELMYRMADAICNSQAQLMRALQAAANHVAHTGRKFADVPRTRIADLYSLEVAETWKIAGSPLPEINATTEIEKAVEALMTAEEPLKFI